MAQYETIADINMAAIPAGTFMMGHQWNPDSQLPEAVNPYFPDEQPVHRETLRAFQLGVTVVTQVQFQRVLGDHPSMFRGDDLPVTNIGAGKVEQFCNALSRNAGLEPCYDERSRACDPTKNGFRLPSEAEWEYACRAGTNTMFNTGDTEADLARAGWYLANSGRTTHPVGQKEPNAWGLFDMHGNIHEFCEDNWIPNMSAERYLTDVEKKTVIFNYYHDLRIARGGSWFDPPSTCRSFTRSCFCNWDYIRQAYYVGFRVARTTE